MYKTIDRVVDECPFCGADVAEGQTECVCGSYTRQHYDTASRMRTNPRASRTPHVEHAFRQHPPSKYARFTSSSVDPHGPQSGLSDKGIRFIFGWPRGSRSSEVQSVKFRADQWTIPQAKKWLREHGYKHDKYEKAQPMRKNPISGAAALAMTAVSGGIGYAIGRGESARKESRKAADSMRAASSAASRAAKLAHVYSHEEVMQLADMSDSELSTVVVGEPGHKVSFEFDGMGGKSSLELSIDGDIGLDFFDVDEQSRDAAEEKIRSLLGRWQSHGSVYRLPARKNPHRPDLPGEFSRAQLDELVREQGGSYATPEVIKAADKFEDDVRNATKHWDEDDQPGPVYMFDCMSRMEDWTRDAPDHLWASYDRLMEEIEAAGESTAGE